MLGIGEIKIDGKGKTAEQIKAEILDKVGEQVDSMLKSNRETKKHKDQKEEEVFLNIMAKQSEDKSGFGVSTEWNGEFEEIMDMFVTATSQTLHTMADDEDDEYNPDLLVKFVGALIQTHITNNKGVDVDE